MRAVSALRVLVVGSGGIGASTVLALAKFGIEHITVFDFDLLEDHNVPNQLLPMRAGPFSMIGVEKVAGLVHLVREMTGLTIRAKAERWEPEENREYDIIIAAVDNMATRMQLFEYFESHAAAQLFIEARMSAETFRVYAVPKNDVKAYQKWVAEWAPDEEMDEIPCTEKATIYNSFLIAGIIGLTIKTFIANKKPAFCATWTGVNLQMLVDR